jgi:hypothetical protein
VRALPRERTLMKKRGEYVSEASQDKEGEGRGHAGGDRGILSYQWRD